MLVQSQRFQSTYPPISFQDIKPTVLIGTSGVGRTFTKDVVEAMAAINEVFYLLTCVLCQFRREIMLTVILLWIAEADNSCSLEPHFAV